MDYERTTLTTLKIGVENEEKLWVCEGKPIDGAGTKHSATITMKVIDINDPPVFKENPVDVYQKEEEKPGKVLFTPEVSDIDSNVSSIRLGSTFSMPAELIATL